MSPLPESITSLYANPKLQNPNDLGLPPKNKFIPQNLSIVPGDITKLQAYPQKIFEDKHAILYHKQDNTFQKPKASVRTLIYSLPVFSNTLKEKVYSTIWHDLLTDYLREFKFMISLTALSVSTSVGTRGFEIDVEGFNDVIPAVFEELLVEIKKFKPDLEKFRLTVEKLTLRYQNSTKDQPYDQVFTHRRAYMYTNGYFLNQEYLDAIANVTFDDLLRFHHEWLTTTRIDCLAIGNIEAETAKKIVLNIQQNIKSLREKSKVLAKENVPEVRFVSLKTPSHQIIEFPLSLASEKNSCILSYYQIDTASGNRDRVQTRLMYNYLNEKTFDQLRTTEALGYIVWTFRHFDRNVQALGICVQSNVQNPNYLASRIENYLSTMKGKIAELSDEEYGKYKESVRVTIKKADLSIYKEAARYWEEIESHELQFDRKEQELAVLDQIKKQEIVDLYNKTIGESSRRCLEIHAISQVHDEANTDMRAERLGGTQGVVIAPQRKVFQNNSELYPDGHAFK